MEDLYEQTQLLKECFLELAESVAYMDRESDKGEPGRNLEEILTDLAAVLLRLEKFLEKKKE